MLWCSYVTVQQYVTSLPLKYIDTRFYGSAPGPPETPGRRWPFISGTCFRDSPTVATVSRSSRQYIRLWGEASPAGLLLLLSFTMLLSPLTPTFALEDAIINSPHVLIIWFQKLTSCQTRWEAEFIFFVYRRQRSLFPVGSFNPPHTDRKAWSP